MWHLNNVRVIYPIYVHTYQYVCTYMYYDKVYNVYVQMYLFFNRVCGRIFSRSALLLSHPAKDPKKDMHASFDGLMSVFKAHLIAAAYIVLGIDMDSDLPSSNGRGSVSV